MLLRMLPKYYEYLRTTPKTLLCRFYGCYAITMHGQSVYFVCMESLFHNAKQIHEKYDLKGSWVDRSASKRPHSKRPSASSAGSSGAADEHTTANSNHPPATPHHPPPLQPRHAPDSSCATTSLRTRKDNDLTRKLRLPPHTAAALRRQCEMDAELLHSLNVMDYSLLLGVHHPHLEADTPAGAAGGGSPTWDDGETTPRPPASPRGRTAHSRPRTGTDGGHEASSPRWHKVPATPATAGGSIAGVFSPSAASTHPGARPDGSSPIVFESHETGDIYYIGIIDLFQAWTWSKRLERLVKIALWCRCGPSAAGMSVVEPRQYCARFVRMVDRILENDSISSPRHNGYQPPRGGVAKDDDALSPGLAQRSYGAGSGLARNGAAAGGAAEWVDDASAPGDEPWRAVEARPRCMSV